MEILISFLSKKREKNNNKLISYLCFTGIRNGYCVVQKRVNKKKKDISIASTISIYKGPSDNVQFSVLINIISLFSIKCALSICLNNAFLQRTTDKCPVQFNVPSLFPSLSSSSVPYQFVSTMHQRLIIENT